MGNQTSGTAEALERDRSHAVYAYARCPVPAEGARAGSFHAYVSRAVLAQLVARGAPLVSPRPSVPALPTGTYCVPALASNHAPAPAAPTTTTTTATDDYDDDQEDDSESDGLPAAPHVFLQLAVAPHALAAALGVDALLAGVPPDCWGHAVLCAAAVAPRPRPARCGHALCGARDEARLAHHAWAFAPGDAAFPARDAAALVHCAAAALAHVAPAHQHVPRAVLERGVLFVGPPSPASASASASPAVPVVSTPERDAARRAAEQAGAADAGSEGNDGGARFYGVAARAVAVHGGALSPENCQVALDAGAAQPGAARPFHALATLSVCHELRRLALVLHVVPATRAQGRRLAAAAPRTVAQLLDALAAALHPAAAALVERAIRAAVARV